MKILHGSIRTNVRVQVSDDRYEDHGDSTFKVDSTDTLWIHGDPSKRAHHTYRPGEWMRVVDELNNSVYNQTKRVPTPWCDRPATATNEDAQEGYARFSDTYEPWREALHDDGGWIYYDTEKPGSMTLADFLHGLADEGKVLSSIERVGAGRSYGAQYRKVYWIEKPQTEGCAQ